MAQTGATIASADAWANADLQLTTEMTTATKDYIVTMYEELANGNYCENTYTVRFVCPFIVSLKDVKLKTLLAQPSSVDLAKQIVITDTYGKTIYKEGAYTTDAARYNLQPAVVDNYDLIFATSGNDTAASFGSNLTLAGSILTWDNDGADLQNDKKANYQATVTIPGICKLTNKTGKVTVLATANSL